MSESANDAEGKNKEEKDEVTWQTYVPGSSLAAIDAKMAILDNMFKSMCRSAGRLAFNSIAFNSNINRTVNLKINQTVHIYCLLLM